jgi:OOP family OmpA-OmpF porin
MKKVVLLVVFASFLTTVNAQEEESTTKNFDYNKWSIELNAGFTKPTEPFTVGAYTERLAPLHVDLGARYMLSPKFGLKVDVGYDSFENADGSQLEFESKFYRVSLQGVANLRSIFDFDHWTSSIGLLAHAGLGYSMLDNDNMNKEDQMMNFIAGLTAQLKLSNKVALTGDFSAINTLKQQHTWDGAQYLSSRRGFEDNYIFNASIGVTVYLGGFENHADWYSEPNLADELYDLEGKVLEIENMMQDSDRDGVPDYLDVEPNSMPGVSVNTKGVTVDRNDNGIPDELEEYFEKKYGAEVVKSREDQEAQHMAKGFINQGYVTAYFDFDKDQPTSLSTQGIDFVRSYMLNNPATTVDIFGYADEIGNSEYNNNLAKRRAENVKNILIQAGISADRINVISRGEDNSVESSSGAARRLVIF